MTLKIQGQEITDENSSYIGDGAYAYKDQYNRLWVFTTNGIEIQNQVCMENDAFDCLLRFWQTRIGDFDNKERNRRINLLNFTLAQTDISNEYKKLMVDNEAKLYDSE